MFSNRFPKDNLSFIFRYTIYIYIRQNIGAYLLAIHNSKKANPPDTSLIPAKEATESAAVIITAAFRGEEFVNVGYFMSNRYDNKEMRRSPPDYPKFDRIVRTIEIDQPRITMFDINWDWNLKEFSSMYIN